MRVIVGAVQTYLMRFFVTVEENLQCNNAKQARKIGSWANEIDQSIDIALLRVSGACSRSK